MIRLLRLQNFKRFEDQSLQFRPLTLLSGLNSTGKSSVLQSLLLLRQSFQQGLLPKTGLALNGDLVRIGTAQDALFEDAKEDSIGFEVVWEDNTDGIWRFDYNSQTDVLDLTSPPTAFEMYESSLFSDNFHYLQAERIGPRTSFEISDFQVRQHRQLGARGEYTAYFLSLFGNKDIPKNALSHSQAMSLSLKNQVEAWMGEVSPGTRIEIASNSGMDLVSLRYSFGISNDYRATNYCGSSCI
jgi:predicted ATPase